MTNIDRAVDKLNKARGFLTRNNLRTNEGYAHTFDRILQGVKNLDSGFGSYSDPLSSVFRGFSELRGFSEGPGLNAVANTKGVDVVDIGILTAVNSFIPYLAAERSMTKPEDLLTYQYLEAMNTAGGLTAGNTAVHPFKPINIGMDLSRGSGASTLDATGASTEVPVALAFEYPIAKGTTVATYDADGAGAGVAVLGADVRGDGKILWEGVAGVSLTINYATGAITSTEDLPEGAKVTVTAIPDTTSDSTGAKTLRLRPKNANIILTAEPNRIILETSMEQQAYMNRLLGNLISAGGKFDYGQVALEQLMNAFVYWINTDLVKATWNAAKTSIDDTLLASTFTFDMTGYTGGNFTQFAETKNDRLNAFLLGLQSKILSTSNKGITYWLVGVRGGEILANTGTSFIPTPLFAQQLNGVIGTYKGTPVLRHDYISAMDTASTNYAHILGGHRDPSGAAAPVIYGEYLPMYSTKPAVNFNNPTELSQALFNMSKSAPLVQEYSVRGRIKMVS